MTKRAVSPQKAEAWATAAVFGDVGTIRAMLADGFDPDATIFSESALSVATRRGHVECVRALLEARADTGPARGEFALPDSPLGIAAREGNAECVALLIAAGADIEHRGQQGRTPAGQAAVAGQAACLRLLIEAGARLEVRNESGWTPAMESAREGHPECLRALLSAGCDVDAKSPDGFGLDEFVKLGVGVPQAIRGACAEALRVEREARALRSSTPALEARSRRKPL